MFGIVSVLVFCTSLLNGLKFGNFYFFLAFAGQCLLVVVVSTLLTVEAVVGISVLIGGNYFAIVALPLLLQVYVVVTILIVIDFIFRVLLLFNF